LHTLQAKQPLDALLPVFDRNEVAIVFDGEEFLGLITRVDLINHLRRLR
jgi:cystathionine beta-synthase